MDIALGDFSYAKDIRMFGLKNYLTHKFQEIKKNGVPIVYAGSLFQQDSGENTTGHGFVIWDIEKNKYTFHEVTNNYKIYKFKISSYDDIKEDNEKLINL